MRTATVITLVLLAGAPAFLAGCQSDYSKETEYEANRSAMERDAAAIINEYKAADPTIERFFREAAGYAVFPKIAKGGAIVGGAHGDGVVYENGALVGYAEVSQGSIGAQLGGQTFSEIIFFQNASSLSNFKSGDMEFSANASAVAAESGAGAAADYQNGVAVFTKPRAGLMFEASIGGQKFDYYPR